MNKDFTSKETGASLIVSLIMLLLLTIIGLNAMQGTVMQEKMVGNMRDTHTAFHAAEISANYSEEWLSTLNSKPDMRAFPCTPPACDVIEGWTSDITGISLLNGTTVGIAQWEGSAITYGNNALDGGQPLAADNVAGVSQQPRLLIESEEPPPDSFAVTTSFKLKADYPYTLTTRAEGVSSNSEAIIQTRYVRRYN